MENLLIRDKGRYGIFKADSNIGIVNVEIYIYGWGEMITVYQNKKEMASVDTLECDDGYYEEDENSLTVEDVTVKKPFIRCLKRFK